MRKFSFRKLGAMVVVGALAGVASQGAEGAVISITSDAADAGMHGRNQAGAAVWEQTAATTTAGRNARNSYNAVYVFQLPTLADGEFVQSADLQFFVQDTGQAGTPNNSNLDLYGIAYRESPEVILASDWWRGGPDDPDATLIQPAIATPTVGWNTLVNTDDDGDAALATFLQAQYDAGAVGGEYVFLRLSPDVIDSYRYYTVGMSEHAVPEHRPTLSITTAPIPEPGSLALLGAGGLLALSRRHA